MPFIETVQPDRATRLLAALYQSDAARFGHVPRRCGPRSRRPDVALREALTVDRPIAEERR
jgi:hypothetical protein